MSQNNLQHSYKAVHLKLLIFIIKNKTYWKNLNATTRPYSLNNPVINSSVAFALDPSITQQQLHSNLVSTIQITIKVKAYTCYCTTVKLHLRGFQTRTI